MLKSLWQKLKKNHLLLMILCCLIPIILIIVVGSLLKDGNWIWLLILLCPLAHFFMMRGMHGGHKQEKGKEENKDDQKSCH